MPFSTIFQLYRGRHFYFGGRNRSTWRKPLTCRKTLTNLSHNIVSSTQTWTGFKLTTLVVIGTDYTGSYKSNYHTITTITALKSHYKYFLLTKLTKITIILEYNPSLLTILSDKNPPIVTLKIPPTIGIHDM